MKLDLNNLLGEIYSWKNIIKIKDKEIENLQDQVKQKKLCIETLENSNKTLFQEISQFNNAATALHESLQKAENYEKENKRLEEENFLLGCKLQKQEKKFLSEINELKDNIERLKTTHLEDIKKNLSEIDVQVSTKLQNYCGTLREKENYIKQLETQISNLQNEKSQEILKVKLESEEILNKMKKKLAKRKGHQHPNDNKSVDIFRQKFIEKEKEAKEKEITYKNEIKRLNEEINALKVANSSFSKEKCLLDDTTKQPENNVLMKSKLKLDASDFIAESETNTHPRKIQAVNHFRKKLFNLDMNYFDK